jgi:hypothetical protein
MQVRAASERLMRFPSQPAYQLEYQIFTVELERRRDARGG